MGDAIYPSKVVKADYILPVTQNGNVVFSKIECESIIGRSSSGTSPSFTVSGVNTGDQTVNGVGNTTNTHNISLKSDDIPEGMYNLYYTDARVDARISGGGAVTALQYQGRWDASSGQFPLQPRKGYYWVISVRGTLNPGGVFVDVEDWIVYNGSSWDVMSVTTDGIKNGSLAPGVYASDAINYLYDCSKLVVKQLTGDVSTTVPVNGVSQATVVSIGGKTANDISTTVTRSHVHANTFALQSVSGVNTGDQTVNGVASTSGTSNIVLTTDDITQGSSNKFFTDSAVDTRISYWKNTSDGVAGLDSDAKILVSQLPSAAMKFMGTWDASSGEWPPTPTVGSFYFVTVAGIIDQGGYPVTDCVVGDWLFFTNSGWISNYIAVRPASKLVNDSSTVTGDTVADALDTLHSEIVNGGFITQLSGDVTTPTGGNTRTATVAKVGGATAANVALAVTNSHIHSNSTALSNVSGVNTGDQTVNGVANTPSTKNISLLTDNVPEGSTNKYYTDVRVDARITAKSGIANGLATLDGLGKIPVSQLPAPSVDALIFVGLYAVPASAENYPAIPGSDRYYWMISVAGTLSGSGKPTLEAQVSDSLIYDGSTWTIIGRTTDPASGIINDSSVSGSTVKDALNTLLPLATAGITEITGDVVVDIGGGSQTSIVEYVNGKSKVEIATAVDSSHIHSNETALDVVEGVNTGDQTVNSISMTPGTHNISITTDEIPEGTSHKYYTDSQVGSYVTSQKNTANGVAGLDSGARVNTAQLPSSVLGNLKYMGTRLVSEGYPSAPGTGHFWVITGSTGSIEPGITLLAGDWLVWNGSSWVVNNASVRPSSLITNDSAVSGSTVSAALETLSAAAAAGITQITGDVTVSTGGGSKSATVNSIGGKTSLAVADTVNKVHTHANKTAVDAVVGVNTGDQTVNGVANSIGTSNVSLTTAQIPEGGSSYYYTDARVDAYVSSISGIVNRLATLDNTGKLTGTQIPDSSKNAMIYRGVWDVSNSGGAYPSGSLVKGYYWVISVAGTLTGGVVVKIGDWIVYNGSSWDIIRAAARIASEITNDTNIPSGSTTVGAAITALNTQSLAGITEITGDVTAPIGTGSRNATVAYVGGVSAANIANAVTLATHSNRTALNSVSGVNTGDQTVNGKTGSSITLTTGDIAEGSNLYYTTTRVDSRIDSKMSSVKGVANGVATLDSSTKIPLSQIPDSIVAGGLSYAGSWDASGGLYPTSPTINEFWIISVAGTLGSHLMKVGDWLIYLGPDPPAPEKWNYINYGTGVASGITDDSTLSQGTVKGALEYTYGIAHAAISSLSGDVVAASGTGSRTATVASVGGASAASVATAVTQATHSNRTALDAVSGVNTGDQTVNGKTGSTITLKTDDVSDNLCLKKYYDDILVDTHLANLASPIASSSSISSSSVSAPTMTVSGSTGATLNITSEASAKQYRATEAPTIAEHAVRLNEWTYDTPGYKVDTTGWYLLNTSPSFQTTDSMMLNIYSPSSTELQYSWSNGISRSLFKNYVSGQAPRVVVTPNPHQAVLWQSTDIEGGPPTTTTNLTGASSFIFGFTNTGDTRYLTDILCHIGGTSGPITATLELWLDNVVSGSRVWSHTGSFPQYTGTPNPIVARGSDGFVAAIARSKSIYLSFSTTENLTIVTRNVPSTTAIFSLNAVDQGITLLVGSVYASLDFYGPLFYINTPAQSLIQISRTSNKVTSIAYLLPATNNYAPINGYTETCLYDSQNDTGENTSILGFSVVDPNAWYRVMLRNTNGYSASQGCNFKIITPQINTLEFAQNGLNTTGLHTNYSEVTSPYVLVYPHVDPLAVMGPITDGICEPAYTGSGRTVSEWDVATGQTLMMVYQNFTESRMYLTQFLAPCGLNPAYNPSIATITATLYRGAGTTGEVLWQQAVPAVNYFGSTQRYPFLSMPDSPIVWEADELFTVTLRCTTAVIKIAGVNVAGSILETNTAVDTYDGTNLSQRHSLTSRIVFGSFHATPTVQSHVSYLKAPRMTELIVLRSDPDVVDINIVSSGATYPYGEYAGEIIYNSKTDPEARVTNLDYLSTAFDTTIHGKLRVESTEPSTTIGDGSAHFGGGVSADGDLRAHTIYAQGLGASPPTPLSNLLLQAWDTKDGFIQANVQNTSSAPGASSDLVATADNGDDNTGFIDMGINSGAYSSPGWTINGPNDGYVYVAGGNLALGTKGTTSTKVGIFTGDTLAENERVTVTDTKVTIKPSTPSTSVTTGALVLPTAGSGLGVNGNINSVNLAATTAVTGNTGAFTSTLSAGTSVTTKQFISNDATTGVKLSIAGTEAASSTANGCAHFDGGISTVKTSVLGGRIINNSGGTDATTTTDGAIYTDGGISVTKSGVFGNSITANTGNIKAIAGNVTAATYTQAPNVFATSNAIVGGGDGTASLTSGTIRGPAGSGSNIAGVDTYLDASNGTGAGGSGKIIIRTAPPVVTAPVITGYTGTSNSNTNTITFAHTVPTGQNRVLIVQCMLSYGGVGVTSMTYAGVSATKLQSVSGGSSAIETWYVVAPTTGSNNVIANLNNFAGIYIEAISLINVNQSTPFGTVTTANSFGTSMSMSPLSSINQLVIDFVSVSAGAPTITGGQTAIWNSITGTGIYGASSYEAGTTPTTTVSYSFANGNYVGMAYAVQLVPTTASNSLTPALTINNDSTIQVPSVTGIVKSGSTLTQAIAGTDYVQPTTGISSWTAVTTTLGGPINNATLMVYFKVIGDMVHVVIPSITVTGRSAAASYNTTLASIPVEFRPVTIATTPVFTWSVTTPGALEITNTGFLRIWNGAAATFTAFSTTGSLFRGRQVSFFYSLSF